MLDFPATGQALWSLYDATGIRPEYLLPPLYFESAGFQSIQNLAGAPYYGVNQASTTLLAQYGLTPAQYLAMPISEQITRVVTPQFAAIESRFGPLRSGTRVYQANFLPATLPIVTSLSGVLAHEGNANEWGAGNVYGSNSGLDTAHKGTITLQDLANAVYKAASTTAVQSAIAQTYALRPDEIERDPVYGTDFPFFTPARIALVGVTSALLWTWYTGDLARFWKKDLRPAVRKIPLLGAWA
jgi:hypothetical protein